MSLICSLWNCTASSRTPSPPEGTGQRGPWRASNTGYSAIISKEYEDKDSLRYVKRLKREGKSLFTFIINDVDYHNNVSERALRTFAEARKILYGNRSEDGARRTKILMSVYATCEQRGVNFYQFVQDYLAGRIKTIPSGPTPVQMTAAA